MNEFQVQELVCRHVWEKFGDRSLMFADKRLLDWLYWFRAAINRPVTINDYVFHGHLTQRGYRCNLCSLVAEKTENNILYASAHTRFQAIDFEVSDMLSEEIRQWIHRHRHDMPVNIRIERGTSGWVHVDVCNDTYDRIIYFNP